MLRRNRVSTCIRVQSERAGLQEGRRKRTCAASGQAFENAVLETSSTGKVTSNKYTPFSLFCSNQFPGSCWLDLPSVPAEQEQP